jgi:hypothetical protein
MTAYLDEIDEAENNCVLRSTQVVNQEQLINATMSYMDEMTKNLKINSMKKDDFKDLKNEIIGASRIHTSGWVLYSIQTITIDIVDQKNIEERVIELK